VSFVIDSSEWDFNGRTNEEVEHAIDNFLAQLDDARVCGEQVWVGDDLQTRAVLGDRSLWDLQDRSSEIQLARELWEGLTAHLTRAQPYLDQPEADWPANLDVIDVAIGDESSRANQDVAWAHHHARAFKAVACLGLWRRGPQQTSSSHGVAEVHWVVDKMSKTSFWRAAIVLEGDGLADLMRRANRAYPNLYFYENVLATADSFNGGFHANKTVLKRYLEVLSDVGHGIFTKPPETHGGSGQPSSGSPSAQLIEQRFGLAQLVVAPENPNVKNHRASREAREVSLGGRTLQIAAASKPNPHTRSRCRKW
jgi:hypothetical protein